MAAVISVYTLFLLILFHVFVLYRGQVTLDQ